MNDQPYNLTLRIDPDLLAKLKQLASKEDRSLNKQVIRILKQYFDKKSQSPLD